MTTDAKMKSHLDDSLGSFRSSLLAWSEENTRDFSWRREDASLFEVLIAEVLLSVTPAERVQPIYERIFQDYPDPSALQAADEHALAHRLAPLGLQNRRARALKEIAKRFKGNDPPATVDELLELPMVGEYAAKAASCFALHRPTEIVDSNVERIYWRVFGTADDEEIRDKAANALPPERARQFNMGLLDFGAKVCKGQSPRCEECFATRYCSFYQGGETAFL